MPRTHILHKAHNALSQTSNNLPWRTSLEDSQLGITLLDKEFQDALSELKGRQRKFVLHYCTGKYSNDEAIVKSGYSPSNTGQQHKRLLSDVKVVRALSLGHIAFQLKYGIDSRWKRQKLVDLYELCTAPSSDTWNPMAATRAMQLLTSMDGDTVESQGSTGKGGVNIVIQTGVPPQKVIIEGSPYKGGNTLPESEE